MSLTTKEMTNIIKKCKFYGDIHKYSKYIGSYVMDPIKTYDDNACKKLEATRLYTNLRRPQSFLDNVFTYKTTRNINREHFGTLKKYNYIIPLTLVIILILLFFIRYRYN